MANQVPAIESMIQRFVFDRTGEKVKLVLGTEDQVAIEPISHHGSTMLGIFWLKVLQHPNNYPVEHYPYCKQYKAAGKHQMVLHVDTVKINVSLVSFSLLLGYFCCDHKVAGSSKWIHYKYMMNCLSSSSSSSIFLSFYHSLANNK